MPRASGRLGDLAAQVGFGAVRPLQAPFEEAAHPVGVLRAA
ncbi:hypothetical protein OG552_00695 [Streptomyces sp. NBC_01476]|nr:hypothetical protein [Streptomyces sp. NBC_01476]